MKINHTNLLQRSAKNDIAAFKLLYDDTYSILYRVARKFVTNHHSTEDIVQESFIKIPD